MSDPPKVVIKSKVTIHTGDDDENPHGHSPLHRVTTLNARNVESDNGSASNNQSHSQKRKSRKSDANLESITLQETAAKTQPVTLKASFLRRKIKEYEGKR